MSFNNPTGREVVLGCAITAGYHQDHAALVRLKTEGVLIRRNGELVRGKASSEEINAKWREGEDMARAGYPCKCDKCLSGETPPPPPIRERKAPIGLSTLTFQAVALGEMVRIV